MNTAAVVTRTLVLIGLAASASAQGDPAAFSAHEIATIRAYYAALAGEAAHPRKGKGLPPGIAKNLARGKPLPPGIAKQTLPAALLGRLPPAPPGHERIVVDGRVLLVEIATQVIRDVLSDVILDR